ncbi:hypothetical protein P168DRAFT_233496 [Aspergillus campestris IBT 28561]|uniref:Urea carboxylase n=1 Tax=Aspergillus campestris (strain IBT 28561) TaxID=1392248 RepID=A0A2I1D815_ASPC2|nr:uncharacterized protein P168DRAFT_233496 [Aspergillus campestris IBT 28561]PKY05987.1 hypothetical protein P168DRAFT_233496 [Aspergillus campestris IBT 28561]
MDALKTVLVANRGEIAVRLIEAARRLNIKSVAIFTDVDATSAHVSLADKACPLQGPATTAYLDIEQIISIAKENSVDAVIPGYGFLSENPNFVRRLSENGMVFVGPSTDVMESLGLKHTARQCAIDASIPIVPGSVGLVVDEEEAVGIASQIGFPVMLKATAGGGGMGLLTCETEAEVRSSFKSVQSRGSTLFKNPGVFVERYFPRSHHIEVQVFGNGSGKAVSFGERECSIQRRHQKVIEECPSPFVENRFPELREELTTAAVRFAEHLNYASAGTIEFLVDDDTGKFFFLEMNTRLQVEHGITEMCYGVDLVELMYLQADAQLCGRGGIAESELQRLQERCRQPQGHAIELRVCAENPARDFVPSPGTLMEVDWHMLPGTRIDTWVRPGIAISPNYDPLIAKIMHHAPTREQAIDGLVQVVSKTALSGPPTNLEFLRAVLESPPFHEGNTITTFLKSFNFAPAAIDVVSGGAKTLVQDFPGRPTIGRGFGHSGPMDAVTFKAANKLVCNEDSTEALEITLNGPDLKFLGDAVIALCGPPLEAALDGNPMPLWTQVHVQAGQRLMIGKVNASGGCRAYLAVRGGFPSVPRWFGSKSTCPDIGIGGYQNRALKSGDYLSLTPLSKQFESPKSCHIPESARPHYTKHWDVQVMGGPFEEGYLLPEDLEMVYTYKWKVSHNAARGGIRLIGPRPQWARPDGGEGGSHPSNVIEWGYPLGGLNWTGDEPVIFPVDCPNFGGFICSLTVVSADLWKVGQLQPGDTLTFHRISLTTALNSRRKVDNYLASLDRAIRSGDFSSIKAVSGVLDDPAAARCTDPAVLRRLEATDGTPAVTYRQGGDNYLLVEYGDGTFDLNHKCRATALSRALRAASEGITFQTGLVNTVGCGSSLQIYYDGLQLPQRKLLEHLVALERQLGDIRTMKIANRTFYLPFVFEHQTLTAATERYMTNQRPYASYLPDNFEFLARNNGISRDELKSIFLKADFVAVGVGFVMALPQCLPADPRHRLRSPKMNPSRTFTPAGAVSWGGSCMALYNADGPGGYMLTGLTIPGVDILGSKEGFSADRPWLFEDMDIIKFYEVQPEQFEEEIALWRSGRYQYKMSDTEFDMAAHNTLLVSTKREVQEIRERQGAFEKEMLAIERRLLTQWSEEKAAGGPSMNQVGEYLQDPRSVILESPISANVWKVLVQEDDALETGQVVIILEAMKLEISIRVDARFDQCSVRKLLVQPGDTIEGGSPLLIGINGDNPE